MATSFSSVHKSSDLVKDYCCGACRSRSIEEIAEMYCETCLNCFCGKCIFHHSQLYADHITYGRGDMNKWPLTKKMEDFLYKCEIHKDKKLKMFCKDHSQPCCTNCAFLNHRLCKEVTLISESLKTNPSDLHELSNKIETILKELKNLHNTKQTSVQSVEGSYSERLQEVRDVRQKLNSALDELERATLKELDDVRTSLQAALKTDVENCNKLMDDLELLSEAVKELADKNIGEMAFIASRKCLDMIQESEVYLKKTSLKFDSSIAFQANTDIEQYLTKQFGIGKVLQKDANHAFTVTKKCEYDLKIPTDVKNSYNTGICVISSDNILVADCYNKRVKLLNWQYKVISHCDVDVSEGNMCQISANEVAVTVDDGLQFISVANLQLVIGRKLQFQHTAGIAHHAGNLYVTSQTALYQYTMTGALVKKIYEDKTASHTAWKCAVSPTGDRIYVTNFHQHKLITLAMDGKILSTFTDPELQQPLGVHVSVVGHVLVCGYSSHTIIQVDREGKTKLATLVAKKDGVIKPVSVCYNSNTHTVILGQQHNNKLYVLEVQ